MNRIYNFHQIDKGSASGAFIWRRVAFGQSSRETLALCVIFLAATVALIGQNFSITYPSPAQGMTVCLNQGTLFLDVEARPAATTTNILVTVNMAPGVTYVSGSFTNVSSVPAGAYEVVEENITNLAAPIFRVVNAGTATSATLSFGQSVRFNVARQAGCAARTHSLGGGGFKDAIAVTGSAGSTSENDPAINNYNVQFPSLTFTQPAAIANAVVGNTYNRNFSIANGALGAANAIHFSITYPSGGVLLNSVSLAGFGVITPTSVVGNTHSFTLSGAQLGGDNLLTNGESLTFTENITLQACASTTNYSAGWGCAAAPASWCQTLTGTGSITMATGTPNVQLTAATAVQLSNMCLPAIYQYTLTNNGIESVSGAGTAFSIAPLFGSNASGLALTHSLLGSVVSSVTINGNAVPFCHNCPVSPGGYSVIIDLTSDPDGAGGLDDLDGDGFYDDLPVGASFNMFVEYTFQCQSTNPSNHSTGGLKIATRYFNQCGVLQAVFPVSTAPSNTNTPLSPLTTVGPSDVDDGEVFTISSCFARRESINSNFYNCTTDDLLLQIKVPPGYNFVPGSAIYNGAAASTYTSNDTLFVVGFAHPVSIVDGVCFSANFQLDCSLYSGGGFETSLKYVCDAACSCQELWGSASFTPTAHCGLPCPEGGLTTCVREVKRITMGYADNTGTTRQDPALVPAANLRQALPCDSILISAKGVQIGGTSGGGSQTWDNGLLRIRYDQLANANLLQYAGGTVEFYDISAGTSSTCALGTPITSTSGGVHQVLYDLSACLGGNLLQPGDSMNVSLKAVILSNNSLTSVPTPVSGIRIEHFNNVAGTEYKCDFYSGDLRLHKYVSLNRSGMSNQTISGCNSIGTSINIWSDNVISDLYPNEYRNMYRLDSIRINLGTLNATLDPSFQARIVTTNDVSGTVTTFLGVPTTQTSTYITWVNPGIWPIGDEVADAGSYRFAAQLLPTCATPPVSSGYTVNLYVKNFDYAYSESCKTTANRSTGSVVTFNGPTINLQNQSGLVQAASPTECFVVRVQNPTTITANNVWIAIPTHPNVTINSVTAIPSNVLLTSIPYAGGVWYQLPNRPGSTNYDVSICFGYTTCSLDSIRVLSGWNCGGYSADPSVYPCVASSVYLPFQPVDAEVEVTAVSVSSSVTLCDQPTFTYLINNAQASNVVLNTFTINALAGVIINPATIQAEYPFGSGNWQNVSSTLVGSNTVVNLTTHPAYPAQGIPGVLNAASNEDRQIGVRFAFETNCDFVSGSLFTVSTAANAPCGAPAVGSGVPLSQNITINGLPALTATNSSATMIVGDLVNCATTSVVMVATQFAGATTGANGLYEVSLPPYIEYVPGSLNCALAPCPSFVSAITQPDHSQIVLFAIPSGIAAGSTLNFEFEVRDTPLATCGMYGISMITTDQLLNFPCASAPGGVCPVVSIQTGAQTDLSVTISKPEIHFTSLTAISCGAGNDLSVRLVLENVSALGQAPGAATVVEFYCSDGSGNPVGAAIASHTMSQVIPAGGSVSEVVVLPSSGCANTEVVAVIAQSNAANNLVNCVCANDTSATTSLGVFMVEAGVGGTICSARPIDLVALGASVSSTATNVRWSTSGNGAFDDGLGVFGVATIYIPGPADRAAGSVTLTLTADDGTGVCAPASDSVVFIILGVDCGNFPWGGN